MQTLAPNFRMNWSFDRLETAEEKFAGLVKAAGNAEDCGGNERNGYEYFS
jgi:hypothetical protein